jgi:CheY-like chemotaxis protein
MAFLKSKGHAKFMSQTGPIQALQLAIGSPDQRARSPTLGVLYPMLPGPLRESLPEHALLSGGPHSSGRPALLVVDNDPEMLQTLQCYFEKRGCYVVATRSLADAKTFLHRQKSWTLVIADCHLPDGTGRELCSWLREHGQATPVLLMSGSPQAATFCGGADYLTKPFRLETLERAVTALLGRR